MNISLPGFATASALAVGLAWAGASQATVQPNLSFNFSTKTFNHSNISCATDWSCIAGEGAAPNTNTGVGPAGIQYIDWLVAYDNTAATGGDDDDFYYFYQVENSQAGFLGSANVSGPNGNPGFTVSTGLLTIGGNGTATCDFDVAGWLTSCINANANNGFGGPFPELLVPGSFGAGPAHVLTGETEDAQGSGAGLGLIEADWNEPDGAFFGSLEISWSGTNRPIANEETGIFGARGTAPTYRNFTAQGTGTDLNKTVQVWNATESGGVFVASPGPVPEPASIALFGAALLGLGAVGRARRRRS